MNLLQSYLNRDTDHIIQNPNNISYKMYVCDFCDYKSESIWYIHRHTKAHHGHQEPLLFKCKYCDYQSNIQCNLKRHEKNIHGYQEPLLFKCKHCDYQSNRRYNLKQHEKNMHGYQEPTNNCAHCDCKNANGKHMKNEDAGKGDMTEEEVKNMINESFEGFPEYMMMKLHTTEVGDEEMIKESINVFKYYMLNKIKK